MKPKSSGPFRGRVTPEAATEQAFAPAKKFAEPYGRTKQIAAALSAITGQRVSRQQIGRWLNGSATPNVGMGLVLILVCDALETPERYRSAVQHEICMTLIPEKE